MPSASASAAKVPTMLRSSSKGFGAHRKHIGSVGGAVGFVSGLRGQFFGRRVVVDHDEEVDVAVAGGLAARPRAEQDHPLRFEVIDHRVQQIAGDARSSHAASVNLTSDHASGCVIAPLCR